MVLITNTTLAKRNRLFIWTFEGLHVKMSWKKWHHWTRSLCFVVILLIFFLSAVIRYLYKASQFMLFVSSCVMCLKLTFHVVHNFCSRGDSVDEFFSAYYHGIQKSSGLCFNDLLLLMWLLNSRWALNIPHHTKLSIVLRVFLSKMNGMTIRVLLSWVSMKPKSKWSQQPIVTKKNILRC